MMVTGLMWPGADCDVWYTGRKSVHVGSAIGPEIQLP